MMYKILIEHKDVLLSILKSPANGKCSGYAEQASTVPIIEKIEASTEVIELKTIEWRLVFKRVKDAGFQTNNRESLTFIEDILNATEE